MPYTDLLDSLVSSKNVDASGTFQIINGPSGTYTKTITQEANGTVDKHVVYTDTAGHTATIDTVFTELSATSVTIVTTVTGFDGATSSAARSYTLNLDGTIAVDAEVTTAKGTSDIVATITDIAHGCQVSGTITTPDGQTGTLFDQNIQSNGAFDSFDQIQLTGQPPNTHEIVGTVVYT